MYFPTAIEPSLVAEDLGIWAPIDHRRVISLLTIGLGVLYHREKEIFLEPLPETMLDEGKSGTGCVVAGQPDSSNAHYY
ncbi:hypothetical protein BH09BAC4_BH09BAC4_28850 [soil metagenome]